MPEPARHLATWEDLVRTPDDGRVYEVLDGEIESSPRPVAAHGRAQSALSGEVHQPFDRGRGGPGGWWILIEPDVMLDRHQIVVPDVVGWKRARLPDLAAERPITVVPDWICEIVSPSDPGRDRVRKADLYLRSGLPYYWIIDPADRTLEAFEASGGRWVRLGAWTDGDTPRIAPFEAIEFDVAGLFLPLTE
jgi:Uma2 family endonuclease